MVATVAMTTPMTMMIAAMNDDADDESKKDDGNGESLVMQVARFSETHVELFGDKRDKVCAKTGTNVTSFQSVTVT